MSEFKLVDGREIETEGKTIAQVISEALQGIPTTEEDLKGIVFDFSYLTKVKAFENTLSPQQKADFYKIQRLQEKIIDNNLNAVGNYKLSRAKNIHSEWVKEYKDQVKDIDHIGLALYVYEKAFADIENQFEKWTI